MPLQWIYTTTKTPLGLLCLLSVLLIGSAASSVAIAYVLKIFVDIAAKNSNYNLTQAIFLTLAVLLAGCIFGVTANYVKMKVVAQSERHLRQALLEKLLHLPEHAHANKKGELLNRFTEDLKNITLFIPELLYKVVGNAFLFVFSIVSLFILSPTISGILIVGLPLIVLLLAPLNIPIGKSDEARKKAEDDSLGGIEEGVSNATGLLANRNQKPFLAHVNALFTKAMHSKVRFGIWEGFALFINQLFGSLMILIVLGAGAYFVLKGHTTLGTLIAMVQLLNYLINPINEIAKYFSQVAQVNNSKERLEQLLNVEEAMPVGQVASLKNAKALIVEGISHNYGEKTLFSNFSYRFEQGKLYCITGKNGAGKTTLLKMLSGVLLPEKGRIYWQDEQNEEHSLNSLLSNVQFADETAFTGSIADNITIFRNPEQVKQNATAMQFLASGNSPLPLERPVDKQQNLVSSGEMRKITFARSAIREASLYLWDEPSSNLDIVSRELLVQYLKALCKQGKIVIMISHDESLIAAADERLEMDKENYV